MRTAQVSELKDRLDEVIEAVRNGETVEIREGISPIAQMIPEAPNVASPQSKPDQSALEAHLDELVRQGKARRGTATFPNDFFTRPLPTARESVLEALLEDRHSD
jgi:antitoxin (DNA-binding transcriptional repressor) of toxin-antitoxin stability system